MVTSRSLSSSSWNSVMTGVMLRHEQKSVISGSRTHSIEMRLRGVLSLGEMAWAETVELYFW
jgi:hypothetical protein